MAVYMTNKITDYVIVHAKPSSRSFEIAETEINALIDEGWQPHGKPGMGIRKDNGKSRFFQVMVKTKEYSSPAPPLTLKDLIEVVEIAGASLELSLVPKEKESDV